MSKHDDSDVAKVGIARRDFLLGSAAALSLGSMPNASLAAANAAPETPAKPGSGKAVQRYHKLGRTGFEISDISFGSSRTTDPNVARHALERGINYFDTAEGYKSGESERALGEALAGRRDDVILTSKVHNNASTPRADLMRSLEGSLRRLRTDRIDIFMSHAVNDVARLKSEEWLAFVDTAKQQGKIRFTGMSGHGGNLVECVDYALDHDLVDVILCAYNFGQDPAFYERFTRSLDFIAVLPELPRVIEKAATKKVGVLAMKTLRGAQLNDMRPYEEAGSTFAHAAFRWVLSNPAVSGVVVSMTSARQIDEYLAASGSRNAAPGDSALLQRYQQIVAGTACLHGCNACESSCPFGVEISEVLRTRMYARSYGDLAYAREDYAKLGAAAEACASCTLQSCTQACVAGLPVAQLTRETEALLR